MSENFFIKTLDTKQRQLSAQAKLYDPPVERISWVNSSAEVFPNFWKKTLEQLKLSEYDGELILKHQGLYLNKRREIFKQVNAGDEVVIYRFLYEPQVIPITDKMILFENDDLVAANKPAWLPIQSTRATAVFHFEELLRQKLKNPNLMALHRLDRQTSGVVLFSKKKATAAYVMKQFADRKIDKTYWALSTVEPPNREWITRGFIKRDFSKLPRIYYYLDKTDEDPKSRFSETHFRYLDSQEGRYLIEAKPITGRTHQIRVHLAYEKLFILGDTLYGYPNPAKHLPAERVQLHAQSIEFRPHRKDAVMKIEAPLPEDFLYKNN